MKGIIKKGSLKAFALAAACLISVSDAGYLDSANVSITVSAAEAYKTWRQGDSRWGDLHLGRSSFTMSGSGCAATAVAMLLVHAGNFNDSNFDPGIFCKLMNQFGGFEDDGDILWSVASKVAPGFKFRTTDYTLKNLPEDKKVAVLKNYCDQGYYMVIDVNSHHWVALDRVENGVVYCFDPATGKNYSVNETKGYEGITCVKLFRSDSVSAAPPEIRYSFRKGIYEITADELKVRKTASVSSEKIGILKKGTHVEITDVSGNWGKIQYMGIPAWICLDYASMLTAAPAVTTLPESSSSVPVTSSAAVTVSAGPVTQIPVSVTPSAVTTSAVTTEKRVYRTGSYKTTDYLNYRARPDVGSEKFGVIAPDTNINIYEVSDNWGRTEYNGKSCWVCLDYTDFICGTYINAEAAVTTAVPVTTTVKVTAPAPVTTAAKATAPAPATTAAKATAPAPVTTAAKATAPAPVTTAAKVTAAVPVTTTVKATAPELTTTIVKVTAPVTTASEKTEPEVTAENFIIRCRTTDALNLRTGAGIGNDVICVLPSGTELTVYEVDSNDRWGRVKYMNQTGWVCLDYVSLIESNSGASVTEPTAEEPPVSENQTSEQPDMPPAVSAAEESVAVVQPDGSVLRGDVDRNGFINVLDYVKLKSYFAGEYTVSDEADVNNDGAVNISDLIALRKLFTR